MVNVRVDVGSREEVSLEGDVPTPQTRSESMLDWASSINFLEDHKFCDLMQRPGDGLFKKVKVC
jgi:hypothetical protein